MALDTRVALAIKPPEIDDPQKSYEQALNNRISEQQITGNNLALTDRRAASEAARLKQQKAADVSRILASSPSPYDAIEPLYKVDPDAAHDIAAKNADTAMKMIQGVSSYQALNSVWPTIQKYVGPQEQPAFQSQEDFDQWKREQALAHVDAKTYLEQTKPSATQDKTREVTIQHPDGTSTIRIIKDEPGQEFTSTPKAPTKTAELGSFADYMTRTYGDSPTPAQILEGRRKYNQSDDRATGGGGGTIPGGASDVRLAVQAMKEGTAPPLLPGRASKDYTAIIAEAKRQNFDIATAATDWVATQKHIATLNGSQQLRLNQSINALPELLDSVDALASKWKAGRFPVLNKATLALAKGGVYGSAAASVASQLDSQIADVVADLGNVYMGGNSPTDHALELAGKSLKSEWDEKVLHDMVAMAKKNVAIRQNSIKNTGVQGASADNPYAPPPAQPPPPTLRWNPATKRAEAIQ